MYQITINSFFESLSLSLKQRKKEMQKKNREIFPADEPESGIKVDKDVVRTQQESRDKRVSRILNNKRPKSHPYLMSKAEVDIFVKTLRYDSSDEMLWGHIDWHDMYCVIIEELRKGEVPKELQNMFYENLIDYVPYSELHYYETTTFGKVWGLYDEEEKEDITDKAINWCYFDSTETYVKELKESFLKEFTGKKLDKFDQKFSAFLENFLKKFLYKFSPTENSFGRQAFKYQEEVDIHYYKLNGIIESTHGEMNEEATLLDEYTRYSRKHINKLAMFQKRFKGIGIPDKS